MSSYSPARFQAGLPKSFKSPLLERSLAPSGSYALSTDLRYPHPRSDAPMSSRYPSGLSERLQTVETEPLVDLIRELASERADGFSLGVAERDSSSYIGSRITAEPYLRDGDAVQGGIELAVAAAVETMPLLVARPDRNRCCAVMHGEGSAGVEPADVGGLGQEVGPGQPSATRQAHQARCQVAGQDFNSTLELVHRDRQFG